MSEQIFEKVCTNCKGDPQPLSNFHRKSSGRAGHASICKVCACAKSKTWNEANPGKVLARAIQWAKDNREQKNTHSKRWKQKTGYDTSDHARELSRDRRARLRREAVEIMGGRCTCCGISVFEFLCFDHIGGWGVEHRKVVHTSNLPYWLKEHGYPTGDGTICQCGEAHKGIRLLCYNCNMSVAADPDGICAHKRTAPIDYGRFSERSQYQRQRRLRLRDEVFTEYGGRCQCPSCDEASFAFLSIEHVGGWGKTHRKEMKMGAPMIDWLKNQGFPKEGFALLCFNCNLSASRNGSGQCGHQSTVALAA